MTRGIWLGALALVGAINTGVGAQSLVWKRVERPEESQARPTVRASSGMTAGASLDRPIAQADGAYSQPRSFPDAYRGGANPIGRSAPYQGDQIPTIAAPGTIIAVGGSAPAMTPVPSRMGSADQDESYRLGDQFASDRATGSSIPGVRQTGGEMPMPGRLVVNESTATGNWLKTYPVTPPPQAAAFPDPAVDAPGGFRPRFYARSEYLLWWTKNDKTPPLVTTGSPTAQTNGRFDGALGNPDTVVLFGGTLQRNPFSGGRFTAGMALDECGEKYFEVSGFFLGQKSADFVASSAQFPLLARPFFAVNKDGITGFPAEFREIVTRPGLTVGNISVRAPSSLWGIEPNFLYNWCEGCNYRIDALAGGRYLNLKESITIVENVLTSPTDVNFPNAHVLVTDRFATSNQFYGGQVGLRGSYQWDRFTVTGDIKVALGDTHEQTVINGFFTVPAGVVNPDPRPGGLLTAQSNIGTYTKDRFAVVPEVGIRLGYDLTECVRLSVGYNCLYWSNVMRPGDQIDRNIDVLQVPNFIPAAQQANFTPVVPARPAPLLKETDYWAQGVTFGVEFRY